LKQIDSRKLTSSFDESRIKLSSEQRIGEVSEELLQKPSYAVNIMEEILRITKIHLGRI
jgi:hypothetical protein